MSSDPHASGRVLNAGSAVSEASLAVVLLHGRGGSAEDILGLASAFDLPGIAYFAPEAAGHTWYPLSFMAPREANEPYLSSALARVDAVIRSIEQAGLEDRGLTFVEPGNPLRVQVGAHDIVPQMRETRGSRQPHISRPDDRNRHGGRV